MIGTRQYEVEKIYLTSFWKYIVCEDVSGLIVKTAKFQIHSLELCFLNLLVKIIIRQVHKMYIGGPSVGGTLKNHGSQAIRMTMQPWIFSERWLQTGPTDEEHLNLTHCCTTNFGQSA